MPSKIEWTEKDLHRFWEKVDDASFGRCWNWKAGLFTNGYGQFRLRNKKMKAHRFAYLIYYGKIPKGKIICHHCDNPKCVNPHHLFVGTHKDNSVDREKKNRHPHKGVQQFGLSNPAAKINPLIVRTIRKYRRIGHTYSALQDGIEFGFGIRISKSQVANIVHKRSWSHVK